MQALRRLFGDGLLLAKPAGSVEKAGISVRIDISGVVILIIALCILAVVAAYLYATKHAEEGRLIIDLAIALFAWATGKGVGEKAGLKHG